MSIDEFRVRLGFRVEDQYVDAELCVKRGDSVQDAIRRMFHREKLPVYLERSVLCAFHALVSTQGGPFCDSSLHVATLFDPASFQHGAIQWHRRLLSALPRKAVESDGMSSLELCSDASQRITLMKKRDFARQYVELFDRICILDMKRKHVEGASYSRGRYVVRNARKALYQARVAWQREHAQLRAGEAREVGLLQAKQAKEMEALMQRRDQRGVVGQRAVEQVLGSKHDATQTQRLVAKHVAEMDAYRRKHVQEQKALMVRQREAMHEMVVSLFASCKRDETAAMMAFQEDKKKKKGPMSASQDDIFSSLLPPHKEEEGQKSTSPSFEESSTGGVRNFFRSWWNQPSSATTTTNTIESSASSGPEAESEEGDGIEAGTLRQFGQDIGIHEVNRKTLGESFQAGRDGVSKKREEKLTGVQEKRKSGKNEKKTTSSRHQRNSSSSSSDGVSKEGGEEWNGVVSFSISLGGSQQKCTHRICVLTQISLEDLCKKSNFLEISNLAKGKKRSAAAQAASWFHRQRSLYSHSLSAMIMVCDAGLEIQNGDYQAVKKLCDFTPELHFPSFPDQINQIQNDIPPSQHLTQGDFVITRHSNLPIAHILFHLIHQDDDLEKKSLASASPVEMPDLLGSIHEKKNDTVLSTEESEVKKNEDQSLFLGLELILKTCIQYDIVQLTLPLVLFNPLLKPIDFQTIYQHARSVIRIVKSLISHAQANPCLQNIIFWLPPKLSIDSKKLQQLLYSEFQDSII